MAKSSQQNKMILNINSPFPIYKIGTRVFQIGEVVFSTIDMETITGILDLGLKYIPNNNINNENLYYNVIKDIDSEIANLNKKLIFFHKSKQIVNDSNLLKQTPELSVSVQMSDNNLLKSFDIFKSISDNLNKINRKNNFEKLNLQLNLDVVDLRFKMIKNLPMFHTNCKSNINSIQFKTLVNFNKLKPFKIIDTDKNTGSAIISNKLHDELVHDHLLDNDTYYRINEEPTEIIYNNITNKLKELNDSKLISKSIFKCLLPHQNNRIGKLRILAKLHKKEFAIRPIVNCKNHFTEKISIFIDQLLKPIIEKIDSYLKDSQNLLQIADKITSKCNLELYSCDFSTLYTSINLDDAIYYTMDSLVDYIDSKYLTIVGLFEMFEASIV